MENTELFANLCIAAMVDGELGEAERKMLAAKAAALQLPTQQANDIIKKVAAKQLTTFTKPQSPAARRKLFEEIVAVVRADKQITSAEQELVRRIGNSLEIDEEVMKRATQPTKKR